VDIGIAVGGGAAGALLAALRSAAEARLIAICGDDQAAVARLARERNAQAFPSLEGMLGCDDVDLVVVASADRFHAEHALKAVRAGKHVWLAPPIAATLEEARQLRDEAAKANLKLCVAVGRRLHPRSLALHQNVAGGGIGSLALIRYAVRRPLAGRSLAAEKLEAMDLVAFLSGKLPTGVFCLTRPRGAGSYIVGHLVLEGGLIGTVELDTAEGVAPHEALLLIGTKGCLRAGTDHAAPIALDAPDGLAEAARLMVRHVRGEGAPPVSLDHSLRAFSACLATAQSASTGQSVEVREELTACSVVSA
jgi:predicted dehydrogenase